MSLLMDALKRAERAREGGQTGESKDEPAGLGETQGLSLDPLEFSPPRDLDDHLDLTGEHEPTRVPGGREPQPSDGEPFSLEPHGGLEETGLGFDLPDLGRDPLDGFDSDDFGPDGESTGPGRARPGFSLIDDPIVDDTSATLPSVKSARESVDSYFDGTRSISISLGAVRTAADGDTVGATRETLDTGEQRNTANTVLSAGQRPRARTNWTLVAMVPLLILAVVAGASYVYWNTLVDIFGGGSVIASRPVPRPVPRPAPVAAATQAAQADRTTPPTPPADSAAVASAPPGAALSAAPASEPAIGGAGRSAGTATRPATTAEASTPQVPPAAAPAGDKAPMEVAALGTVQSISERVAADVRATVAGPTAGEFSATPKVEDVMKAMESPAATTKVAARDEAVLGTPDPELMKRLNATVEGSSYSGGSAIKITRRSVPARVHPLITRGYDALRRGDLKAAENAYRRILRAQPRSRDAMLGLAAVAMQRQDWTTAQDYYLRLLSLNPRDTVARAAVLSLQSNADPVQSEALVKTLLRQEPNDAYLHFSLGNMFAEQKRWPEAQQAYFDAHRLDAENADYAFNLAVALDQLIQPTTALNYYRRALELAGDGYAGFQTEMVLARISALQTGGAQ